jgi:hypothetical protein
MARHLVPATLDHFNELTKRITLSSQLIKGSAFNKVEFIRYNVIGGEILYSNAYKSTVGDLGRLPMYVMIDGIHHPKWHTLRERTDRRLGTKLFNILLGSSIYGMGEKANHLYSVLNENKEYKSIHRGLIALPFIMNPAAFHFNPEGRKEFAEEALNNISKLPDWFYTLRAKVEYKGTYNEIHNALGNVERGGIFTNFTFKKGTISVCYGAIIDFERKKVLAMLTLNRDFTEYFLLHKYSQSKKKLHPQIFNVVVDKEFSENTGEHYAKELWTMVRKGMCEVMEEGITTEAIDGSVFFQELYDNKLTGTTAPLGPLEQIEQNAEMQQRFLHRTVTANTLRERNIVLID